MKNNSKRKTNKPAESQTPVPLREQIETRAYQIWIASGGVHGRDVEHWVQAETEILNGSKPPAPTACFEVEDLMSNPLAHLTERIQPKRSSSGNPSVAK